MTVHPFDKDTPEERIVGWTNDYAYALSKEMHNSFPSIKKDDVDSLVKAATIAFQTRLKTVLLLRLEHD